MKILIFGGTGEARDLANRLIALGHEVTTSLAGRTQEPMLPQGDVRKGGFGGVDQLERYFRDNGFDWVIDATHPYAGNMSAQLAPAAEAAGVKFLRLQRPEWERPNGADWVVCASVTNAIARLPDGAYVLMTTGHEALDRLATRDTCHFVVRLIEQPAEPLPDNATLLIARPPFTRAGEKALMRARQITHLTTKNAGGAQTRAKIDAAAALGITTFMVARPELPPAREVATIEEALGVLQDLSS